MNIHTSTLLLNNEMQKLTTTIDSYNESHKLATIGFNNEIHKVGVKLSSCCTHKHTTNTQLGASIVEIKLKKYFISKYQWAMGTFFKN